MHGSCLCGDVSWEAEGELSLTSHCHCSRCRKMHGSAYGTYAETPARSFSLEGSPVRFESSPGFSRWFCPRCGSATPGPDPGEARVLPLGGLDGDPGVRPLAHIFVASKAPWFTLSDALPRFDAYPPGMGPPPLPDRPQPAATGAVRGSCLCGGVAFEIAGRPDLARFCHCGRCRKARAAAFASNLFVAEAGIRFTRGAERLVSYKLPEAQYFTQAFCGVCGGKLPRIDPARKLAVVPMGALDDDPGIRPSVHIFVGSKAPWDAIHDALPQVD